jgi:alpha-galactosidase
MTKLHYLSPRPEEEDEWVFSLESMETRNIHSLSSTHGASIDMLPVDSSMHTGVTTAAETLSEEGDQEDEHENDELSQGDESDPLVGLAGSYRGKQDAERLLGWTFRSPYWTLQSDILLSVTYFPAWQALPGYTNRVCCVAPCASASSSCCCASALEEHIDYFSHQYTSDDILAVETIPEYARIKGMDTCAALRVYLPNLPLLDESFARVPPHLSQEWQRAKERIHQNTPHRRKWPQPDTEQRRDAMHATSICLTFALPMKRDEHPLLWRVEFPSLQEFALESLTILDGKLSTTNAAEATHIYINGYQSWSFAGSIPRGHPQPTSALPNVFSRAFNYGGSCPPPSQIWDGKQSQTNPFTKFYQSDFFTCITSDVPVPRKRQFRSMVRETLSTHNLQTIKETLSHANLGTIRENLSLSRANLAAGLSRQNLVDDGNINIHPSETTKNANTPYQQLDETGGPALLVGWLSNRHQFGVIAVDQELDRLQMHCSGHGQVFLADDSLVHYTDWAYAQLIAPHSYDEEPMAEYLQFVATSNYARPLQNGSLLTGWCSWYFAYERISAQLLRDNFSRMSALRTTVPTNVSVVDDGYMTAWGDWDSVKEKEFPHGMAAVSRDISQFGMRAGLWMAPFAADKHSKLTKENPSWVIQNHAGEAANSSNCGKWFYGLDATNPAVREYVRVCVQRAVKEWKFSVLKIDFLYAACLEGNGKFDLSMNRAEAMDLALQTIRDAAGPDVYLIGCGCPIATGIGFVDAMRVSADTGPTWYPAKPLPYWDNGTLPSLRAMLRNSVARAPFGHRWWHNDPDCLMFGEHTRLTDDEIASAASIVAMTCGMLLLSDDLPKVPARRMRILNRIFPLTGVSAVVLDLHSTNGGIPSILRLWCTDKYGALDRFRKDEYIVEVPVADRDYNAAATFFARQASFHPDCPTAAPEERQRSCIHVTAGLGTWTVVSISNWLDRPDVVHIPPFALLPPPTHGWGTSEDSEETHLSEHGYHVFAFWSSKYSWLPQMKVMNDGELHSSDQTISKYLNAHATEIFHIKPVTPDWPQYIGSDFHFTCGQELLSFRPSSNSLRLNLSTELQRSGRIFIFIPRVNIDKNVRVTVAGEPGRWNTVGNTPRASVNGHPHSLLGRIISIMVTIRADKSPKDGQIEIDF